MSTDSSRLKSFNLEKNVAIKHVNSSFKRKAKVPAAALIGLEQTKAKLEGSYGS